MYDSIQPLAIPADVEAVAGYIDGPLSKWPDSAWGRFTKARVVIQICTWGPRKLGNCLDIERGDSIVEDARPWALDAMARGVKQPKLYMSLSDFPEVRSLTSDLPVLYWVAHYTGAPHLPAGADACQYADQPSITGGGYDLSICQPWFA
jgi:hypothetical protein